MSTQVTKINLLNTCLTLSHSHFLSLSGRQQLHLTDWHHPHSLQINHIRTLWPESVS